MAKDQTPSREEVIAWAREAHGELLASGRGMHVWHEDAYVGDVQAFCERFAALVAAAERERLHDKFMEIHKSQQHSNNYWHFAARKIKEQE